MRENLIRIYFLHIKLLCETSNHRELISSSHFLFIHRLEEESKLFWFLTPMQFLIVTELVSYTYKLNKLKQRKCSLCTCRRDVVKAGLVLQKTLVPVPRHWLLKAQWFAYIYFKSSRAAWTSSSKGLRIKPYALRPGWGFHPFRILFKWVSFYKVKCGFFLLLLPCFIST